MIISVYLKDISLSPGFFRFLNFRDFSIQLKMQIPKNLIPKTTLDYIIKWFSSVFKGS